jgi:hypothetical protein
MRECERCFLPYSKLAGAAMTQHVPGTVNDGKSVAEVIEHETDKTTTFGTTTFDIIFVAEMAEEKTR